MDIMSQLVNLSASLLLLIAFAFLFQRKLMAQIYLLSIQGFVLSLNMLFVGIAVQEHELLYSAVITFLLKVIILPYMIYRVVVRLRFQSTIEINMNTPIMLLIGIGLVILGFTLSLPMLEHAESVTRATLGIALACVLLSLLVMSTRQKALTQAIAFLSLENSLLFTSSSTSSGMPLAIELGIALDVLIATLILGVFFFHIRQNFDSLDIHDLEKLKEK